jgi:small subunit ribosomal protein S2
MVDTNSDPREVDFLIPANDDASKSIECIMSAVESAVAGGLAERKSDKAEKDAKSEKSPAAKKEVKAEVKVEAKAEPKEEAKVEKKAEPKAKATPVASKEEE